MKDVSGCKIFTTRKALSFFQFFPHRHFTRKRDDACCSLSCFFLLLAFAGDDTVDTNCQFCECGLPDEDERRSCEALECCKVFHSLTRFQNFINNDPFNPRSVVKGDLVASCLCCSCANVTCSSNVAYTLDSTSTQSGDGAKQNLNQKPVVQMTRDSVEEHGFTLADYHRGLLKDRTRIETRGDELNCDDFFSTLCLLC